MKKIFFLAFITFTPLATIMNTANATFSVTVTITDDDADQTEQAPQHPLEHECIYAPHREHYLAQARKEGVQKSDECVFCADIANHEDPENFILARYENVTVFLNLFPYMRGHLLIIPREHVPELRDLSQEARVELVAVMAALPDILREELGAQRNSPQNKKYLHKEEITQQSGKRPILVLGVVVPSHLSNPLLSETFHQGSSGQ